MSVKEHHIVFGLTDHECSVLQGALQDRAAEDHPDDETCKGLEAILLDQLGPEDGDGGWDILKGEDRKEAR
jgi:hypothetical protein